MKIELTVTYTSTYEIEEEYYEATTPQGQLQEDIDGFDSGILDVSEYDDFERTVTGRLV